MYHGTLTVELCSKAKLSTFGSVYVPIPNNGHERWIMNKIRSRVHEAEMRFDLAGKG